MAALFQRNKKIKYNIYFRRIIFIFFCFNLTTQIASAKSSTLFHNYTEDTTNNWQGISESLANQIVTLEDIKKQIDEEITRNELPKGYRQFFVQKSIPLSTKGASYYFIRPSLTRYSGLLYGPHTYLHWIAVDGKVLYSSASDRFRVLRSSSKGLRDIEESQCIINKCYVARLRFDGSKYKNDSCFIQDVGSGKNLGPCPQTNEQK